MKEIHISGTAQRSLYSPYVDLWNYRFLIFTLAKRHLLVRNRQTLLGGMWYILHPVVSAGIFSLVFGLILGVKGESGVPYPVFVLGGMMLWRYFSAVTLEGSTSIVGGGGIIAKLFVPKPLFAAVSLLSQLFDSLIVLSVFLILLAIYGRVPPLQILLLPLVFLAMAGLSLGISLIIAPIHVLYRDVAQFAGMGLQLALFITPVVYPPGKIPHFLKWLDWINPMSAYISWGRWMLIGKPLPNIYHLMTSLGISAIICLSGAFVFTRLEYLLADRL